MDRNAAKQIREEIQAETRRESMERQLKEAIVKYTEGEQTIDEAMYSLLHKSSQIGARLRQKSKKFITENFDIKARYEVDDIYSLLTEELWKFVAESPSRFEEIMSYLAVLDYRCDMRLLQFKRRFLANKRRGEQLTYPKKEDVLDYVELQAIANGNYTVSTYRSSNKDDEEDEKAQTKKPNRRKYLVTGYEETFEDHALVNQMLEAPELSEEGRRLIQYLHLSPDASLSEIAGDCGYTSKKAVSRAIQRIARHLNYLIRY
ncbi:hypothetical protein [Bacillus cereus]|uniref:hypothetical protein n=2 Tax=Bacillus cereus TaxID=1396 RepID=UPI000BF35F95|nr:hypothetical protein [Bacillus cereus]PEU03184.1 hypothetical protein CN534_05035 [Bacillus cereus]PEZ62086.1 hypothetical protein CN370_09390 [Bacillus cereus]PFB67154.1 hypothetical protein CN292_21220 [Bacillus cereus]